MPPRAEYDLNIHRDALADANRAKRCQDCKWVSYDMDGNYCAHPQSLAESAGFGRSLQVARAEGEFCGPEGKLHEPKV